MKITKIIGEILENFGRIDSKITEIRFIWIPGMRPVKVPTTIPKKSATKDSRNINIKFVRNILIKVLEMKLFWFWYGCFYEMV